jgi:endoglucanase Acf2
MPETAPTSMATTTSLAVVEPVITTTNNTAITNSESVSTAIGTIATAVEEPSTASETSPPPTTSEQASAPTRTNRYIAMAVTEDLDIHKKFMRYALDMADKALRSDEVPVGCVFVYKNEVIGRGKNDTNRSLCVCFLALFCLLL